MTLVSHHILLIFTRTGSCTRLAAADRLGKFLHHFSGNHGYIIHVQAILPYSSKFLKYMIDNTRLLGVEATNPSRDKRTHCRHLSDLSQCQKVFFYLFLDWGLNVNRRRRMKVGFSTVQQFILYIYIAFRLQGEERNTEE